MDEFQFDKMIEARVRRREAAEDAAFARRLKRQNAADALVGHLKRDGKTVYYITTRNGKHKEGMYMDLIDFLLRNYYV